MHVTKACGLDAKHALAFNVTMVKNYFMLLAQTITTHNIKLENLYNVDEKGLQLSEGRKNLPTQFIFSKTAYEWYALRSDSLVLVTLIEAVCADSSTIPPIFILPKGSIGPWWEITGVSL